MAFVSRTLSKSEKNYSVLEEEALGIVFSVTKLRQYLLGNRFTLYTDHKPLEVIFGENKGYPCIAADRIQRWSVILSSFNYSIKYIKGSDNQVADSMSRIPQNVVGEDGITENSYINFV